MALVREMEAKLKKEHRQLLEVMADYLRRLKIGPASIEDSDIEVIGFGGRYKEPVIRLKGQDVDRIRLLSTDYLSCGMQGSVSRFVYEVRLNKTLSDKDKNLINTRTKMVRKKMFLGIPAGKITGVRWVGHGLADHLNSDSSISGILIECARSLKGSELLVNTANESAIQIQGPKFYDLGTIKMLYTTEHREMLENCVFGFNVCNKIAHHARQSLE
jgi:hypothetical protein